MEGESHGHRLRYSINHPLSQWTPTPYKLKQIDRFGDANRVNTINFNAMTMNFSDKIDHPFSHVFIFGNMFPESHGFVV